MTKNHNLGHRKRVRDKFLQSSGKELAEYELLEILLFSAIPRSDTKILAKKLLEKFGDISSIINANQENLKSIEGIGQAAIVQIKIIAEIINRVLKKTTKERPILNNWQALLDYANFLLKDLSHEEFHVLFLDKKHHLIESENLGIGESDFVNVSSKSIAKKALLLNASSIILLHNHPSQNSQPSKSDILTTQEIVKTLKNLQIKVIDHLIISKNDHFSFKEQNLV